MERINELINQHKLVKHPEGGYYRETYRNYSSCAEHRSLMTSIYFLLTYDNPSKFHRIKNDEHWYFHEGNALTIHTLTSEGLASHSLGLDFSKNEKPYILIPGNTVFGSEITTPGGYALVSCAVTPGFEFEDFELFSGDELLLSYPNCSEIIEKLT